MLGLTVFFLGGWLLFGDTFEQTWSMEVLSEKFEASRSWAWLAGIGLLVADLLLPVPGTIVMSALGAVYGVFVGGIVATAGSVLAGIVGYGVGRFFDEGFARKWLGSKDFETGGSLFKRSGAWVVAASRAVPILPEVITCMAGLLRMPFGKFVIALVCGSMPMGFLFAWIGALGKENPEWGFGFSLVVPAILWLGVSVIRKG
ncbi:TVP38/TMEM64 family protein [Luteolibacter algae]|uniref:TVP38/TMEM64 family protein n=1 Tax=Luteolibacter algae TaxID=454151 RepID=A0ABW5D9R9_9BACT